MFVFAFRPSFGDPPSPTSPPSSFPVRCVRESKCFVDEQLWSFVCPETVIAGSRQAQKRSTRFARNTS